MRRRSDRFEQVEHAEQMLSLANARNEEELRAWETRIRNHLKRLDISAAEFSYTTEPKIDGLAISLTYEDGVLVRGATRGDGRDRRGRDPATCARSGRSRCASRTLRR